MVSPAVIPFFSFQCPQRLNKKDPTKFKTAKCRYPPNVFAVFAVIHQMFVALNLTLHSSLLPLTIIKSLLSVETGHVIIEAQVCQVGYTFSPRPHLLMYL